MPKSKRARVVPTSKVTKKDKSHKIAIFGNVQDALQRYPYAYVVNVANMRNNYLKDVRASLEGTGRLFFGKNKLIAKALLGDKDPADDSTKGIAELAKYLRGSIGLIFSSSPPSTLIPALSNLSSVDFARAGSTTPISFSIPAGVVYSRAGEIPQEEDLPLAHSQEPGLRALGVPSRLVKGKVELDNEYQVCNEGDVLDSRQTRLLKMFGVAVAEFRIEVVAYWSKESGEVKEMGAMEEDS